MGGGGGGGEQPFGTLLWHDPEFGRCIHAEPSKPIPEQLSSPNQDRDYQLWAWPTSGCLRLMTSCFVIYLNHGPKAREILLKPLS